MVLALGTITIEVTLNPDRTKIVSTKVVSTKVVLSGEPSSFDSLDSTPAEPTKDDRSAFWQLVKEIEDEPGSNLRRFYYGEYYGE